MSHPVRPALSLVVLAPAVSAQAVEVEQNQNFALVPTIAFSSTRDYPSGVGSGTPVERLFNSAEIYLIATPDLVFDPSQPVRRVTHNEVGDNDDHAYLTRGASAAWDRGGRQIAFQASASGIYTEFTLARNEPGAPTLDSDIYVMNVDECIAHLEECRAKHVEGQPDVLPAFLRNLTKAHGPDTVIDEDPDWSPDGTIVFTRHDGEVGTYQDPDMVHNNTHAEVYLIKADQPSTLERVSPTTAKKSELRCGHQTAS